MYCHNEISEQDVSLSENWSTMTSSILAQHCSNLKHSGPHWSLTPKMMGKQGPGFPLTYACHVGSVFLRSQPVLRSEPVPQAGLGVGPGRGQGGSEVPVLGGGPPAEGGRGLEAAASDRALTPHWTPQ